MLSAVLILDYLSESLAVQMGRLGWRVPNSIPHEKSSAHEQNLKCVARPPPTYGLPARTVARMYEYNAWDERLFADAVRLSALSRTDPSRGLPTLGVAAEATSGDNC